MNITSVYHEFKQENLGQETQPTLFLHHNKNKPFHVGYCFVSKDFKIENIEVGEYSNWIGKSDHMPIFVELQKIP